MTTPLRFVILGCGRMGRLHLERLRRDGRGIAVALFDAEASAVETLRRELASDAAGFTQIDDLLNNTMADAAIICTPTSLHFEQVRACRSRGWSVLCEKPLADQREDVLALIADNQSGGPIISIAYQRRTWPIYLEFRDAVQSGQFGRVCSVTVINTERWQQSIGGTWRDDPQINRGGFLGDAGSHKVDMAFFVTGLKPVDVFARHERCGSRVEIVSSISARLDGDVPLTMHFAGNANTYREDMHVHCEHADLLLRDWQLWLGRDNSLEPLPVSNPAWQSARGRSPLTNPDLDDLGNPVRAILDQLLLSAPAVAPPECALPVFDFTQAALHPNP